MKFNLKRYFSISSLIGITIVVAVLSFFYRHIATKTLIEHETRANAALARAFANSIWPRHKAGIMRIDNTDPDYLLRHSAIRTLGKDVFKLMRQLDVVKVKIYNLQGITVFSTDRDQLGTDKSKNPGFLAARAGEIISEMTFRNQLYTFEGVLADRNLLATYIPLRENNRGEMEAVFELYSDVTELVANIRNTQLQVVGGVLVAFLFYYLFLHFIVSRASHIIRRQEQHRQQQEKRIHHQAYHDALTGLPNKNKFSQRLTAAMESSMENSMPFALMFVDLDRFKLINDSLGHEAGDQLIRLASRRLKELTRGSDLVFRWGGDEFTVIVENMENSGQVAAIARRVIEGMAEPMIIAEQEIVVTTSIGIAVYPNDSVSTRELINNADAAMYHVKKTGKNRFEFYTPEMNAQALERLALENGLKKASQHQEFVLLYQPKYNVKSSRLVSAEALIRWNHPNLGMIAPGDFIPALEESGLINEVGEWVLRTACRQNRQWQLQGLPPIQISVNISAGQFRHGSLVDVVRAALAESGLGPDCLVLELTESMLIPHTDSAIETMHRLKQLGVKLSIDDFGSGYSSLSYLKRFPVDYLKVDRSFVRDLAGENKEYAITRSIAVLARSLNMEMIAEGVETMEQLQCLQSLDCHICQGYLFSKPVTARELEKLLSLVSHRDLKKLA